MSDREVTPGEADPVGPEQAGGVEGGDPAPPTEAPVVGAPVEEPKLRRRPFGRAQELVSELSLGTWGLSGDAYGPVYHKEIDRVIDKAIDHGITLFETADVYGDGSMERKLGERLDADEHKIVTKIGTFTADDPPTKRFDEASLREAFDKSQERIGRDVLDVVLLHNPSTA
ncbi:MAG: aldo/keto reductase, partial [Polyangiaceae bacterium]